MFVSVYSDGATGGLWAAGTRWRPETGRLSGGGDAEELSGVGEEFRAGGGVRGGVREELGDEFRAGGGVGGGVREEFGEELGRSQGRS